MYMYVCMYFYPERKYLTVSHFIISIVMSLPGEGCMDTTHSTHTITYSARSTKELNLY